MKYALTLILAAAILLAACTEDQRRFAIDAAQVSLSLATINTQFDLAVANVDRSVFSAEEQARLDAAIGALRALQTSLKTLITQRGGVGQLLLNVDETGRLFAQGKQAYLDAKAVIVPHLKDLPLEDQRMLSEMDRSAKRIDQALQAITTAPDGTDITPYVHDALLIAKGVATLAAAL